MTVEQKVKLFGLIPLGSQELFHYDGEVWTGYEEISVDHIAKKVKLAPKFFRVVSDNEVALFRWDSKNNSIGRGKPEIPPLAARAIHRRHAQGDAAAVRAVSDGQGVARSPGGRRGAVGARPQRRRDVRLGPQRRSPRKGIGNATPS